MAKYYVSASRGSDSTGVGSATNPWKTINKAIGVAPAITLSGAGDQLYIEPGIYREAVALTLTPTAAGPLSIIGDSDGAGFLSGGYTTPATGLVDWRAWSNDLTPLGTANLSAAGKSYVTLRGVKMLSGNGSCVSISNASLNWTFQDCILVAYLNNQCLFYSVSGAAAGAAWNATIERCDFIANTNACATFYTPQNTVEYNLNIVVRNCRFIGRASGLTLQVSGGVGAALGTGVTVQNCGFYWCNVGFLVYGSSAVSLATPIGVYGNYVIGCATGLQANNTSQMVEDGNILSAPTPRVNVDAGPNSITAAAPALDFGDGRLTGLPPRFFGEPMAVSPFGGWGNFGTPPTIDMLRRARPEGFASTKAAAGPIERHDTGAKDVTQQDAGSPACMALVGPSSQERPILVNAQSTTLSIKVRWDGNHGDGAKPQAMILANPEVGVAAQTITATSTGGTGSTPNAYETLTFAPFTPSSSGVVILRMVSRSASGNGAAYFDTITLS